MTEPPRAPARTGRGARSRALLALSLGGCALIVALAWQRSTRVAPGASSQPGPGAALVRGSRRLARIERVMPRRGRPPAYVALVQGPVIDSARVGALVARLAPGSAARGEPVIALVPRDSVAGLAIVGRLVVTPGESGLLVFGTPTAP